MSGTLGASSCALPSRTDERLGAIPPTPSFSSASGSPPFRTQAPALLRRAVDGSCSSTPNEVLLKISTQVLIPDYTGFYAPTPIAQFRMTYSSFPDGSLVAPPYLSEVRSGDWTLLFSGMMLMLFTITSIVATNYIRRVKVKHKGLFYALLVSQLCGVVSFILIASTVLSVDINCRDALVAAGVFTEISSAFLLSGILGVKAYRCLNDSKIVLCVIIVLQLVSSILVFLTLAKLDASRKLSLTCVTDKASILFSLSTTVRFMLALFICFCFFYCVWKSEKLPAAQGRISIYLSGNAPPPPLTDEKQGESNGARPRGWWDYVPETSVKPGGESRAPTWHIVDDQGFVGNMRYLVGTLIKNGATEQTAKRKGSEATLVASPQRQHRSRPSVVHFQDNTEQSRFSIASRAQSSTFSKAKSLGQLMNRMRLFREVMKNELAYTALITLFNVIATILGLVGVFAQTPGIDPEVFIGAYWGILSLLVMQSFRRVVHRHERETLLQHPSTWDPLYHVEKATRGEVREGVSASASVSSNPFRVRSMVDPLSDVDEGVDALDRQESPSKSAPDVAENPFEDFVFAGPSSNGGKHVHSPKHMGGLAPDVTFPSKKLEFDVSASHAGRDKDRDTSSSQWTERTETLSRDSVSKYSEYSSRPQSLFYLEKTR